MITKELRTSSNQADIEKHGLKDLREIVSVQVVGETNELNEITREKVLQFYMCVYVQIENVC